MQPEGCEAADQASTSRGLRSGEFLGLCRASLRRTWTSTPRPQEGSTMRLFPCTVRISRSTSMLMFLVHGMERVSFSEESPEYDSIHIVYLQALLGGLLKLQQRYPSSCLRVAKIVTRRRSCKSSFLVKTFCGYLHACLSAYVHTYMHMPNCLPTYLPTFLPA